MRKAFTMIELVVVMTIIAIMAGFGIPSFTKAMTRAKARDAMLNLRVIHAANVLYKIRNGADVVDGVAGLVAINAELGLNIIANGVTYSCDPGFCSAITPEFEATVDHTAVLDDNNPACVATVPGSCP